MKELLHGGQRRAKDPPLTDADRAELQTPQARALLGRLYASVNPDTEGRTAYVESLALHLLRRRSQG